MVVIIVVSADGFWWINDNSDKNDNDDNDNDNKDYNDYNNNNDDDADDDADDCDDDGIDNINVDMIIYEWRTDLKRPTYIWLMVIY